jgi:hypothetical protein
MSGITIRGMGADTSEKLKKEAKKDGKSVNQFVLEIIRQHVGAQKEKKFTKKHHDLDDLFGIWPEKEFETIDRLLNDQRKIDVELWE